MAEKISQLEKVLEVLTKEFKTVRELSKESKLTEPTIFKHCYRLVEEGTVVKGVGNKKVISYGSRRNQKIVLFKLKTGE